MVKILKKIIFWPKISFFVFKTNGPESPFKKLSEKYNIIYKRRHMVASKGHDQNLRKRDFWSIRLDSTMWRLLYMILYFLESFFNGLSGPLVLKTKKAIFDQKIIFLRILTKFGQ